MSGILHFEVVNVLGFISIGREGGGLSGQFPLPVINGGFSRDFRSKLFIFSVVRPKMMLLFWSLHIINFYYITLAC